MHTYQLFALLGSLLLFANAAPLRVLEKRQDGAAFETWLEAISNQIAAQATAEQSAEEIAAINDYRANHPDGGPI